MSSFFFFSDYILFECEEKRIAYNDTKLFISKGYDVSVNDVRVTLWRCLYGDTWTLNPLFRFVKPDALS